MPKARVEREVSNDGKVKVVEIETAAGGEEKGTVKATYAVPATPEAFQEMVLNAATAADGGKFVSTVFQTERKDQGESPLAFIYRMYVSSIDKAVRASVYESIQAESTEISIGSGKPKFDLMTVPVDRLIVGINGMRGKRVSDLMVLGIVNPDDPAHEEEVKSVDRKLNYRQFQTAARRLVEDGKAKENAASGMLEAA